MIKATDRIGTSKLAVESFSIVTPSSLAYNSLGATTKAGSFQTKPKQILTTTPHKTSALQSYMALTRPGSKMDKITSPPHREIGFVLGGNMPPILKRKPPSLIVKNPSSNIAPKTMKGGH